MSVMHKFNSTSEAYGAVQCDENISEGDLIWIPSENVVGIAYTWPFAVTKIHGSLHYVADNPDGKAVIRQFARSVMEACNFAEEQGYELNEVHKV